MNTGHRTVAGMLAVVAVMLGLNLTVGGSRPAAAQEPEIRLFPEPPVRIIELTAAIGRVNETRHVWRLWSDGVIEENRRTSSDPEWRGWEVVPDLPAP